MNANTNQMTQAFTQAGIKPLPVMHQLWNIIKEQQGSTFKQLKTRASHINQGTIASTLNDMEKRGMTYSRPADIRTPRKKAYFTDMERYELLPRPNAVKQLKGKPTTGSLDEPVKKSEWTPVVPAPLAQINIDQMTVAEARNLYQQLHKMFGG